MCRYRDVVYMYKYHDSFFSSFLENSVLLAMSLTDTMNQRITSPPPPPSLPSPAMRACKGH